MTAKKKPAAKRTARSRKRRPGLSDDLAALLDNIASVEITATEEGLDWEFRNERGRLVFRWSPDLDRRATAPPIGGPSGPSRTRGMLTLLEALGDDTRSMRDVLVGLLALDQEV